VKTHIASLLAIFLNFGSALALEAPQLKDPMTVVIVRSADPHCEPNCPEWISAEGQFAPGVDAAFAGALRAMGNRRLPIFFNSPGGSLEVAIRIGHMVRDRQLDVAVSKTIFDGCGPKDKNCAGPKGLSSYRGRPNARGAFCASACVLALAGGVNRYVGYLSRVGVHQFIMTRTQILTRYIVSTRRMSNGQTVTTKTPISRVISPLGAEAETLPSQYKISGAYLRQMGIGDGLLPLILKTPASGIHWLDSIELGATHIATERTDPETLVGTIGSALANVSLIDASGAGDFSRVTSLLSAKADVNAKSTNGATALIKASWNGHFEVVRALLAAKADVNTKDAGGYSALVHASQDGHLEVVRALLAANADANAKTIKGETALMWASRNGHLDVVQVLLAANADVNAKDGSGNTALILASRNAYAPLALALLNAKADANAVTSTGETAMSLATKGGFAEIIRVLKESPATTEK
jgi:uncharacterized protein